MDRKNSYLMRYHTCRPQKPQLWCSGLQVLTANPSHFSHSKRVTFPFPSFQLPFADSGQNPTPSLQAWACPALWALLFVSWLPLYSPALLASSLSLSLWSLPTLCSYAQNPQMSLSFSNSKCRPFFFSLSHPSSHCLDLRIACAMSLPSSLKLQYNCSQFFFLYPFFKKSFIKTKNPQKGPCAVILFNVGHSPGASAKTGIQRGSTLIQS